MDNSNLRNHLLLSIGKQLDPEDLEQKQNSKRSKKWLGIEKSSPLLMRFNDGLTLRFLETYFSRQSICSVFYFGLKNESNKVNKSSGFWQWNIHEKWDYMTKLCFHNFFKTNFFTCFWNQTILKFQPPKKFSDRITKFGSGFQILFNTL